MSASKFIPGQPYATYEEYRAAKQREHRKAYKQRNKEAVAEAERMRLKRKYATDEAYAEKVRERANKRYQEKPEEIKAVVKTYALANKERLASANRDYQQKNKARISTYKKAWIEANRASVNRRNSERRAICKSATPAWADKDAIQCVYEEARYMQMHVDHIVPLKHPLVCGLHVWENLQLLTPLENMRKNNRFDPENFNAD